MQTLILTKSFIAKEAISSHRLLTLDRSGKVKHATDAKEVIIGVSSDVDTAIDNVVDVHLLGIADVKVANAVDAGSLLSCDAEGRASVNTTSDNWVVGIALQSASTQNDIISVLLHPFKQ